MANRHRYIGALAVYGIIGAALNAFVLGGEFSAANLTAILPALALFAVAIFVPNRRVQIVTPIVLAVLFAVYLVQYFSSFSA